MLSVDDAKRIGINACIDKLGRSFVTDRQEYGTSGYGECEEGVYCFVAVDDGPHKSKYKDGQIVLDSITNFSYSAKCIVSLENGAVNFMECVLPENKA